MGLPGLGKYRGAPMSLVKLRKERRCKECIMPIPKGTVAYRSLLFATINDIMRCDRICPNCMKDHGEFLPGS